MTLKADVKRIFVKPPCNFVFRKDDTQAVARPGAILQCKDDHTASLMCQMPRRYLDVVQFNTNLLVTLLLVAGWKDGDQWLAQCFREVKARPQGKVFEADHDGKHYTLVVDRGHELTTLTVKETT